MSRHPDDVGDHLLLLVTDVERLHVNAQPRLVHHVGARVREQAEARRDDVTVGLVGVLHDPVGAVALEVRRDPGPGVGERVGDGRRPAGEQHSDATYLPPGYAVSPRGQLTGSDHDHVVRPIGGGAEAHVQAAAGQGHRRPVLVGQRRGRPAAQRTPGRRRVTAEPHPAVRRRSVHAPAVRAGPHVTNPPGDAGAARGLPSQHGRRSDGHPYRPGTGWHHPGSAGWGHRLARRTARRTGVARGERPGEVEADPHPGVVAGPALRVVVLDRVIGGRPVVARHDAPPAGGGCGGDGGGDAGWAGAIGEIRM